MAKPKPAGTVTHTIFLPEAVHKQIIALAPYGEADDLIVECVVEAIKPRWEQWITDECEKLQRSPKRD